MSRFNARALIVAAAIAGGSLALFLSLYPGLDASRARSSWSGWRGAISIPLAVFVPAAIPFAFGPAPPAVTRAAFAALMAFLPVSIAVALFAVLQRYYG